MSPRTRDPSILQKCPVTHVVCERRGAAAAPVAKWAEQLWGRGHADPQEGRGQLWGQHCFLFLSRVIAWSCKLGPGRRTDEMERSPYFGISGLD